MEHLHSDIGSDNPKQFKKIEINELPRLHRYKYFKKQIEILNKKKLVDFEKIKDHPIFEKLNTNILGNIAQLIDRSKGNSFEELVTKYDKAETDK